MELIKLELSITYEQASFLAGFFYGQCLYEGTPIEIVPELLNNVYKIRELLNDEDKGQFAADLATIRKMCHNPRALKKFAVKLSNDITDMINSIGE